MSKKWKNGKNWRKWENGKNEKKWEKMEKMRRDG